MNASKVLIVKSSLTENKFLNFKLLFSNKFKAIFISEMVIENLISGTFDNSYDIIYLNDDDPWDNS